MNNKNNVFHVLKGPYNCPYKIIILNDTKKLGSY